MEDDARGLPEGDARKEEEMLEGFHEGGWGMYPTSIFGLIALGAALRFAFRGDPRLRGFIESMSLSILFSGLTGFVTGLMATAKYVETHQVTGPDFIPTLVQGIKESTNNLALAFTLLSLIYLVVGVGRRRVDARRPQAG